MLGFGRKKSAKADAVPLTLSAELLAALTGACPLPEASENERRAFGRICIGTRATLRAAGSDCPPVPVLLRDLCAASVGVLVDSPVETDKEYWIYIPKPDDPDDVVALCCVMVRCDPGGFERSAYVAAATFIEGDPPPLEPEPAQETAGPPNQLEEEGHHSPPARRVGGLFLPTPDPAPAAAAPTTPDPAASDQQTPPAPQPVAAPPSEPVGAAACDQEVTPPPPSQPCPAPPVCQEPSPQIPQPAESPKREESEPAQLTPDQIRRIADTIKPHLAYLKRLMNRMDHHQASPDASLRQDLDKANQAVEQLHRRLESMAAPASQAPGPKPDKRAARQPNKGHQPVGHQPKGYQPKPDEILCLIQLRQALLPSIN